MAVRHGVGALGLVVLATGLLLANGANAYTVKQTDSGATVRWHTNHVSLRIDESMYAYFADMQIGDLVRGSAQAWHGLAGVPELSINEGNPGPRGFDAGRGANNGVYLIEDWELADSSLAVTVATFESRSGKIVDTDILVNANHTFGVMPDGPDRRGKAFDLRGVMTHEMGHVLGLGESFDVRMATMWPNIARGETHQRDISLDDEDGAELAYAYAPIAELETPGCGGSAVVMPRAKQGPAGFWFVSGGLLIGAGLWLRSRARRSKSRGIPALALVLLFGAPSLPSSDSDSERVEVLRTLALRRMEPTVRRTELSQRVHSPNRRVRMAAAAVIERAGVREEISLASRLAQDADPQVSRVARSAVARLRTAPPATRIRANTAEARARLATLIQDANEVVAGEAVAAGVQMRGGLIWSRYLVHGKDRVVEVQIPGGTLGDYAQVVSEQEPPADGDTIVVAQHERGKQAWAHMRNGVVYGGFLGDGPAIEWTP
jgi:hypothetical protein